MEGREWKHNFTDGEHHIREYGNGDCVAHTRSFDRAEQIVTDHNQHTTLVEQRDLLVAAARKFVDAYRGKEHQLGNGQARRSLDEFRAALATVEQGGEA